jgi:NAD(P)-dependent dehydrogenase (short-subunit alcohol dehydrogenase family)
MRTVKELQDLRGRRAVITGACGAIGRTMAGALAEMGATLVLVDRPEADFASLVTALVPWGHPVETEACDLELHDQRLALIGRVAAGGGVDILINNAAFVGVSNLEGWAVPFSEQTVDTWRRALEVNLTAPFHLCQGLSPLLLESKAASVINIGSIYGLLGPDWGLYADTKMSNPAAYAASKGGVTQLTRWLATTLAPKVRVNSISPGGVLRNQPEAFVQRYEDRTPLGRMAGEEDFIGAVAFLASDLSRYVTGQNLVVDGGWGTW